MTTTLRHIEADPECCPYCGGDWIDYAGGQGDERGDPICCPMCEKGTLTDAELLDSLRKHFHGYSALARVLRVSRATLQRWARQGNHLDLSLRMRLLLEQHAPSVEKVDAQRHLEYTPTPSLLRRNAED